MSAHNATTSERTLPFTKNTTESNKIIPVTITAFNFYIFNNREAAQQCNPLIYSIIAQIPPLHEKREKTCGQQKQTIRSRSTDSRMDNACHPLKKQRAKLAKKEQKVNTRRTQKEIKIFNNKILVVEL
jgi:hypothetical protein